MKKNLIIIILLIIGLPITLTAQDRSTLRAARMSFNSAEKNYKDGNYREAVKEYTIVINTIPVLIDSRRYLNFRLQSVIGLIDINFNKTTNFNKACQYVDLFFNDMETVKASDILRASDRLHYLRKEQYYVQNYVPDCKSYRGSERDRDKFRKHYEQQLREKN